MTRTDDDSWDITESVGATALGVATARAAETERDDPLISDPFAAMFLAAVGDGTWTMFSNSPLPPELVAQHPDLPAYRHAMIDYMACRTAFFDNAFRAAADAGLRQAVIVAAGLDARAWRLPWPAGTTVYELDQPQVLAFKSATLSDHQPRAARVEVPVDLRQDWPSALTAAGFDASAPSTWSVEGLMPYLPAQAQDLLFENVDALTAPGSSIAAEAIGKEFLDPDRLRRRRARLQRYSAALAEANHTAPRNVEELWYLEPRSDVGAWLGAHGWDTSVTTTP
ncbi:MAG TPA: class I SAM-dependent methyltransferase, partial [Mycobacterium sp.]|nr:class I SAM-dependent methyltransferase [Mycobacterium sp.]